MQEHVRSRPLQHFFSHVSFDKHALISRKTYIKVSRTDTYLTQFLEVAPDDSDAPVRDASPVEAVKSGRFNHGHSL